MTTTPLEREILTHYYITSTPFPRRSELISSLENMYIRKGMLERDGFGNVRGVDAALKVYMEALGAVPLPVNRWVMP